MQVVKNILMGLLVFWLALIIFMPKQELYFAVERELAKQDVEINEEKIESGLFSLTLSGVKVYVKGIEIASIEEVDIFTLLVYNTVEIKNILFDDSLKSFVPQKIEKSLFVNSLLSPFKVFITTMGSFGLAEGEADMKERTVRIDLLDAKDIKTIQSLLKKDEKGWYYESAF